MSSRRRLIAAAVALLASTHAFAQDAATFPDRPINVVIPSVPGGVVEVLMRDFFQRISRIAGQEVIVLHKPGAGGELGAQFVARAKPDGYTLLGAAANLTTPPEPGATPLLDPIRDLTPVSILTRSPTVLMVHPSVPVNNAKEYFDYARANPGKLNFASPATTTRFTAEWMNKAAGVDIQIIDYKGAGQMMPDLLAGRVHATAITLLSSMPHIRAGKMKALGISTAERSKMWPELATLAEQGAKGYQYVSWVGVMAPAGTPKPIVDKLHALFAQAAQDPDLRKKLEGEMMEVSVNTPAESATFMRQDLDAKKNAQEMLRAGKK